MKKLIPFFLFFCSSSVYSAQSELLESALACKLKDSQVASLMRDLAAQVPAFGKPGTQVGAPAADIYQLPGPFTALGYSSAEIVVTPGRILLAVPGKPVSDAIGKLKLKEEAYSPASRQVRPTVSVVAFQLSHKTLEGKLLVGCEYANSDAARWVRQ